MILLTSNYKSSIQTSNGHELFYLSWVFLGGFLILLCDVLVT
jgi:hypothetical protein